MKTQIKAKGKALLLDLDGTLLDTAGDLVGALNRVLEDEGKALVSIEEGQPYISTGVAGLIKIGFGLERDEGQSVELQKRLVDYYSKNMTEHTVLFDGMENLLARIESQGMQWGVVTNKSTVLTLPLLKMLGLFDHAACVVCRDTTAEAKPSPMPMHHACEVAGITAETTLYVGDALTDMQAANSAGMISIAARYGYLMDKADADRWQADGFVDHPSEIADWLALCASGNISSSKQRSE